MTVEETKNKIRDLILECDEVKEIINTYPEAEDEITGPVMELFASIAYQKSAISIMRRKSNKNKYGFYLFGDIRELVELARLLIGGIMRTIQEPLNKLLALAEIREELTEQDYKVLSSLSDGGSFDIVDTVRDVIQSTKKVDDNANEDNKSSKIIPIFRTDTPQ